MPLICNRVEANGTSIWSRFGLALFRVFFRYFFQNLVLRFRFASLFFFFRPKTQLSNGILTIPYFILLLLNCDRSGEREKERKKNIRPMVDATVRHRPNSFSLSIVVPCLAHETMHLPPFLTLTFFKNKQHYTKSLLIMKTPLKYNRTTKNKKTTPTTKNSNQACNTASG